VRGRPGGEGSISPSTTRGREERGSREREGQRPAALPAHYLRQQRPEALEAASVDRAHPSI